MVVHINSMVLTWVVMQLKALQSKVDVLESGGQKLVQRQQQIATLRKQLKTRDDTISEQVRNFNHSLSSMI
jgi:peptidoglycan hydrolase CwlO-like protein